MSDSFSIPEVADPPDWLDDEAINKWNEVWRKLDFERFDPQLHLDTLTMYCQTWSTWKDAIETVRDQGSTVKTDRGGTVPSPFVMIRDSSAAQLQELGEQLGLRPDRGLPVRRRWDNVMDVLGSGNGEDS